MKYIYLAITLFIASFHGQLKAEGNVEADAAVRAEVQQAVQKLGNEVLKNNFRYAVEKMYPRWKVRQAKRLGSEEKLLAAFLNAGVQMQESGITIDLFTAEAPTHFYRVHPQLREGVTEAKGAEDVVYQLMAFVPTKMKMTFLIEGQPKQSFMRQSFQVAVKTEGTNEWTFIDGATIRVSDLRSLFPLLPHDLVLPPKQDEEIK